MSTTASKTDVRINLYDLLPPGWLSSLLWTIGNGLLHSGVVIGDREYAFGAHGKRGISGVYWTTPRQEPPGGTFRCEILHGYSFSSPDKISDIILEASHEFLGPSWNLLTNNCNHFTSVLCMRLTGKPAPAWLNRAASIGIALPCVLPREWVVAPDAATADGELMEADLFDERAAMLGTGPPGHNDDNYEDDENDESYDSNVSDVTETLAVTNYSSRVVL